MLRYATTVCLAAGLLAGACSEMPTTPSPSAATSAALGADAKPGGGGPTPSEHRLGFSDPLSGNTLGFVDAGEQAVSGWIAGPTASGNFLASAEASAFTLKLTAVGPNPDPDAGGNPCTADEQVLLEGLGLVGGEVTGVFTLTIEEDRKGSLAGRAMNWELSGINVEAGNTWKIIGGSGSTVASTFPQFSGSATDLTVTVENGRAHFFRYPDGSSGRGNKPSSDLAIACRVNLKMRMTKQQ